MLQGPAWTAREIHGMGPLAYSMVLGAGGGGLNGLTLDVLYSACLYASKRGSQIEDMFLKKRGKRSH